MLASHHDIQYHKLAASTTLRVNERVELNKNRGMNYLTGQYTVKPRTFEFTFDL